MHSRVVWTQFTSLPWLLFGWISNFCFWNFFVWLVCFASFFTQLLTFFQIKKQITISWSMSRINFELSNCSDVHCGNRSESKDVFEIYYENGHWTHSKNLSIYTSIQTQKSNWKIKKSKLWNWIQMLLRIECYVSCTLAKNILFLEKSCFLFLLVDCASICGWLKLYDTVRFYPSVKSLPIEAVDGYVRLSVHSLALSIQRAFLRALPLSVSGSRALSLCLLASLSVSIA